MRWLTQLVLPLEGRRRSDVTGFARVVFAGTRQAYPVTGFAIYAKVC
jgi:hypothetical protein